MFNVENLIFLIFCLQAAWCVRAADPRRICWVSDALRPLRRVGRSVEDFHSPPSPDRERKGCPHPIQIWRPWTTGGWWLTQSQQLCLHGQVPLEEGPGKALNTGAALSMPWCYHQTFLTKLMYKTCLRSGENVFQEMKTLYFVQTPNNMKNINVI